MMSDLLPLTQERVTRYAHVLAERESLFQRVLAMYGPPPLWSRPPGFPTLVWIILEQQVSLASARAAFNRLKGLLPDFTPEAFLKLDDATLKAAGFSRQKTGYCRGLAQTLITGELNLEALTGMDDDAVRAELIRLKGIGAWTADIYLIMALLRPDIWPAGDLGLVVAVRRGLGLEQPPDRDAMAALGETWRPYRSVAARLFWHYYLSEIRPAKNLE
jgi:DNA-3-methyladenine glycosylase II